MHELAPVPRFSFEHVHVACRDVEEMQKFFVDVLGGRLAARRSTKEYLNVEIDLGGGLIFLRRLGANEALAARPGVIGNLDHIGLRVADLNAALAYLRSAGLRVLEGPVDWRDDLAFAYVEGPEGLIIELLDRRARSIRNDSSS